jgi:predicted amidophosphoribosyltransferase
MPLSRQRLKSRGFNQAHVLARALDPHKLAPHLLLRIQDTPPQTTLPRKDRLLSVQHAFAVDPLHAEQLRGKRVVLVDDVMTSGASLHAASGVLRAAGASHITTLVFARTE